MSETGPQLRRKLAVILAADVAGYSALVAADDEGTIRRFGAAASTIRTIIARHEGRVFNTAGDAILAEFDSAVNAVRAAVEIQALDPGPAPAIAFRIGIAIGDVVVADGGDLLGDGVNIAARLQTVAAPGGIVVSRDVRQLVHGKIAVAMDDLGPQSLKNIPQPVAAFAVRRDGAPALRPTARRSGVVAAAAAMAVLAGAAVYGLRSGVRETPPTANAFDANRVPLVTDEVRQRLVAAYVKAGGAKALAISNDGDFLGIAVNAPDEPSAAARARESCERDSTATHKRPCFDYALGERVLIDTSSFPMPADVARTPIGRRFGIDDPPLRFMQQGQRLAREYPAEKRPKALAIGTRGDATWGAMSTGATQEEAVRRSLEFCGYRTRSPCILYGLGDEVVAHAPATRRIVGVLDPGSDKTIPAAERTRIVEAYGRPGWHAVSRGRNGSWHVAHGAGTEAQAVEIATNACRAADRDCSVYAVGRFLVNEP